MGFIRRKLIREGVAYKREVLSKLVKLNKGFMV